MIPALRLAGFCLIGFAACRVPGPLPPTRTVAPAVVAPAEAGTGWQGSARPGAESETVASERERQNHTSALGMGPGPIGPDRPRVVFADNRPYRLTNQISWITITNLVFPGPGKLRIR